MSPATPENSSRPPAQPLRVADECWMISDRNPELLLQCNTYLRIFPGARHGTSICIDPGSQNHYAAVKANIQSLTQESGLNYITVNHQDPDVTANLPALCEQNPAANVMLTMDTWRLLQHTSVRPGNLHFAPPLGSRPEILPGGIAWQPVPTPFCHFRGAMAWYDPELRVLFSGDLFGGLNPLGRVHLFAEEADWGGIAQFHQIYMPCRDVLRHTIRQIRALNPAVKTIAPQHGYVITGELVPLFLEKMEQLLVGYDLLAMELEESFSVIYHELTQLMLEAAKEVMGLEEVAERLRIGRIDDGLEECLAVEGTGWKVTQTAYSCATKVFERLSAGEEHTFTEELRNRVLAFCSQRGVPVPPIGWGFEGNTPEQTVPSAD